MQEDLKNWKYWQIIIFILLLIVPWAVLGLTWGYEVGAMGSPVSMQDGEVDNIASPTKLITVQSEYIQELEKLVSLQDELIKLLK